jgi:signal transduction histidine kinase
MVKATNEQGQWSVPLIQLPVIIHPPFWKTWWFIAFIALLFICALYLAHLYRLAHVKKILMVRTKISQDLHDDIGGSLSSIYIYSSVAEKEVTDNPVKAKEFLRQINTNSLQMMDNISDIVWANNPTSAHESTLEGRIKNYGYELLAQKNIECEYAIYPHIESKLSSPEARRNIVLIIKEACNNMAKYSEATTAKIAVTQFGTSLLLIIEDNGQGFEMESGRQGNGILTMTQRAASLGGQFTLKSAPGSGTKISCMIPLAKISD